MFGEELFHKNLSHGFFPLNIFISCVGDMDYPLYYVIFLGQIY